MGDKTNSHMTEDCWTIDDLRDELDRFEQKLRAANLAESSVQTYVQRTAIFLRWLTGDYQPQGPRSRTR